MSIPWVIGILPGAETNYAGTVSYVNGLDRER
jgi:hypothetical protein